MRLPRPSRGIPPRVVFDAGCTGCGWRWTLIARQARPACRAARSTLRIASHRRVVSGVRVLILDQRVGQHPQPPQMVIENQQRLGHHENRFRQLQVVRRRLADGRLEEPDHVIPQIPHRPAREARQVRQRHRDVTRHQLLQFRQRVRLRLELRVAPVLDHVTVSPPALEHHARIAPQERVPPAVVDMLRALQQEREAPFVDLRKSGNRRLRVRDQLRVNRNQVPVSGQLAEFLPPRLQFDVVVSLNCKSLPDRKLFAPRFPRAIRPGSEAGRNNCGSRCGTRRRSVRLRRAAYPGRNRHTTAPPAACARWSRP